MADTGDALRGQIGVLGHDLYLYGDLTARVPGGGRDEFIGQRELKEHLSVVLEAARRRGQPADHVLLAGPPGLGHDPDIAQLRRLCRMEP